MWKLWNENNVAWCIKCTHVIVRTFRKGVELFSGLIDILEQWYFGLNKSGQIIAISAACSTPRIIWLSPWNSVDNGQPNQFLKVVPSNMILYGCSLVSGHETMEIVSFDNTYISEITIAQRQDRSKVLSYGYQSTRKFMKFMTMFVPGWALHMRSHSLLGQCSWYLLIMTRPVFTELFKARL